MDLTPVSEMSSTAEYEEECDMLGIIKTGHLKRKDDKQVDPNIDKTKDQLESENKELHLICGYLDQACRKGRHLGSEWQSFGKYTAEILKEEIANSESKNRVMKEQLDKLTKENKELKEMCLFLDQSRDGAEESSLTPPEAMELMLHGHIAGEMNRTQGQVPRYTGLTQRTILKDSQAIKKGVKSEMNKEMALTEMKKRLDRVEAERLELIKSLSAAHTLAAEVSESRGRATTSGNSSQDAEHVQLSASLQEKLDSLRKAREGTRKHQRQEKEDKPAAVASPDVILNAVTLLDVVRRLDAATVSGFSDAVTEGEALALRLLVNIAWQKIQESLKTQ